MSKIYTVFGHATSQPTRAVLWLLAIQNEPNTFVKADPMGGFDDEFKRRFPIATIPQLHDASNDLNLGESHAIFRHICTQRQWRDWLPTEPIAAAKVDEYLHWHHHNTRLMSVVFFRPLLFTVMLKNQRPRPPRDSDLKRVHRALNVLDGWLTEAPYLANSQNPTVADLSAYCEFDQLLAFARAGVSLIDFSRYPHLVAWFERMRQLPAHDDVRRTLDKTVQLVATRLADLPPAPAANL